MARGRRVEGWMVGLVIGAVAAVLLLAAAWTLDRSRIIDPSEVARADADTTPAPPTATTPAAPPPLTVTRPTDGPLRVLFAGDSLTGGLSATTEDTAFKWLMLDALDDGGEVEEFNSALSGGTTIDVSGDYEVPEGLHLAVIELGTNDLAERTPIPEFRTAYADLVSRVVDGSPGVALVCAGVWQAAPGPETDVYNAVIEEVCTARGGRFASLTPIYSAGGAIGPAGLPALGGETDDFHPNDTGHRAIADLLLGQFTVI